MTRSRSTLVSVADTPYYHVIGRCVRRAFLCGEDALTGKSFEHRRAWLLNRLRVLTDVFAVDLCAYAILSNHYHLVVKLCPEKTKAWSSLEVARRWTKIFTGPPAARRYTDGGILTEAERLALDSLIPMWTARLCDLSWFMRCLNETIARQANLEDGCKGHFWEARFRSQALLDEGALLTAMVYVDLNPVRAGMANSLETSDFTSIQQRLFDIAKSRQSPPSDTKPTLLPFVGAHAAASPDHLPFSMQDYVALVDTAGRVIRSDKRGALNNALPPLLDTLGIQPHEWLKNVTEMQRRFESFVGAPHRLQALVATRQWRWVRGLQAARRLYRRANE